ncbi:MAG: hypothetical protein NC313_04460 [Butyrivibrio sp.]|nr:hypothetical protein [Butyrivibrio sp.]
MSLIGRVNHYQYKDLDLIIMTGLCSLTVYAQIFSLFYKVGTAALIGVFFIDAACLIFMYRDIIEWINKMKKLLFSCRLLIVVCIGLAAIIMSLSAGQIYDTNLYHAQAIRWIEEYRVVPGLGNLHSRLACNSSFFCLQALFSFRGIIGQSLHGMNGFIMWIILSYVVCSFKFRGNKKIYASDFVRMVVIWYYVGTSYSVAFYDVASPGTDVCTMGLVGYIVCKWIDLLEQDRKNIAPYAYLCILGVYVATFKLSSAMIVLLVIMPAYCLIKERKWKEIALYIGLGVLTIAPFLARNVILSGYLVYPYPGLDLFSPDWKIPVEDAEFMKALITTWAQGFRDTFKMVSFSEWFPIWRENILPYDLIMQRELIIDIIAIPIAIIIGIVSGLRNKDWNFFHVTACLIAGIVFWFFNAPTRRFGEMYLILLPAYLIGSIAKNFKFKRITTVAFVIWGGICIYHTMKDAMVKADRAYLIRSADYDYFSCQQMDFYGLTVYYPEQGTDLTGYHYFPSVPDVNILSGIELRGDSFEDGFRVREP